MSDFNALVGFMRSAGKFPGVVAKYPSGRFGIFGARPAQGPTSFGTEAEACAFLEASGWTRMADTPKQAGPHYARPVAPGGAS